MTSDRPTPGRIALLAAITCFPLCGFPLSGFASVAAAAMPQESTGRGASEGGDPVSRPLLTADVARAVESGYDFLEAHQNRDGSFGTDSEDRDAHVGVTALVGLAWLAGGELPGRGPRGRAVERCLEAVLASLDAESGLLATERTLSQPMYGHAFATLFLAECYGMSRDARVGKALRRAIDLIVAAQNPEGGWRYYPGSHDADLSVTACQVSALRAARNAGVAVPAATIDRAIAYVLSCARPDGSFRYQIRYGHPSFHLTSAGVTILHQLGLGDRPEAERGFDWIAPFFPEGERPVRGHLTYGMFYALQAAWQRGDGSFERWYPRVRDLLLARQRDDGAFDEPPVGDLYGTSMALFLLQLPRHSLPVLLR